MSTVEALEHYRFLTRKVFSKTNRKRNGTFKATTLEVAMKLVIKAASEGYSGGEYMIKGSKVTRLGKRYISYFFFNYNGQMLTSSAALSVHYRCLIQGFLVSSGPTQIQQALQ